MTDTIIRFDNVSKSYSADVPAVNDISFSVEPGQILALLGSSGCGKTTTLRLLAGLEKPDSGEIWLNGDCAAGPMHWLPPEARRVGMVFQEYALFPHLTIAQNVAFPLNRIEASERQKRTAEVLELVGLLEQAGRYPHQLSGGQQQRVALARALAPHPAVILLDEPFSNLDASLRKTTREEVKSILREEGTTTILVTHDQEEALSFADKVAVMRHGEIRQIGSVQEIYLRPATIDVAAFVGEANFISGMAGGLSVDCVLGQLPLAVPLEGHVRVLIRPEMIDLMPDSEGIAEVEHIQFLGYDQLVRLRLPDDLVITCRTRSRIDLFVGLRVRLHIYGRLMAYPEN